MTPATRSKQQSTSVTTAAIQAKQLPLGRLHKWVSPSLPVLSLGRFLSPVGERAEGGEGGPPPRPPR